MKIGILGAGWIAERMAETCRVLSENEDISCSAIGSRSLEKARAFAEKFGIEKVYGSYEELADDENIDLIYVATPHSHHFEHAMLYLEKRRNVLVEKAFTVNAKQAKELLASAKSKHLLCAEAIWTRYMPSRFALDKILKSGIIGEVSALSANLGYNNIHMERMYAPELAGGALLDLGVYAINFALSAFGTDIDYIESSADLYHTGVDLHDRITIHFKSGRTAELYVSLDEFTDKKGIIRGSGGYIEFENINNCEWIRTHIDGAKTVHFDVPKQITGFEYQLRSCQKVIESGGLECPEMPHEEIVRVMEIMDSLREEWGVKYPFEK
ncbi:MAG: Gfo/Idh/MocA family oxidoreductase [Oscillospiraceae bacterium]|nr:Gfo/Idh/MocA family oxidoreductase [Oscillospiraceae bacterium]